ncbi:hypothetical protein E4U24_004507 [Claviceps purpurea]|nr:hypothetical protein E4U24_004507 [Claviceps purpurea]
MAGPQMLWPTTAASSALDTDPPKLYQARDDSLGFIISYHFIRPSQLLLQEENQKEARVSSFLKRDSLKENPLSTRSLHLQRPNRMLSLSCWAFNFSLSNYRAESKW